MLATGAERVLGHHRYSVIFWDQKLYGYYLSSLLKVLEAAVSVGDSLESLPVKKVNDFSPFVQGTHLNQNHPFLPSPSSPLLLFFPFGKDLTLWPRLASNSQWSPVSASRVMELQL